MTQVSLDIGPWIRRFHEAPQAPGRLVCFPHAGGSSTYYFPVSRALSPRAEVLAVQYPGRQDRRQEPCIEDIETLADRAAEELAPFTDVPVSLFGHSMGATIAYEVARRLEAGGTKVEALFVSGRRAPSRVREETVHLADDDRLIDEITQLSGTDAAVLGDPEILRMILPAVRSDYKAAETYRYRPGPPLTCPLVALIGDDDPQVSVAEAESWEDHTTGSFRLQVFAGGHFYLDTHSAAVLDIIRGHLPESAPAH